MGQKIRLDGMAVDAYRHPDEQRIYKELIQKSAVKKMLSGVSALSYDLMSAITDGRYIELAFGSVPALYHIVQDVCQTLGYQGEIPCLYLCHKQTLFVKPYGVDKPVLLVSDYFLKSADQMMFAYMVGNAISMIMAGQLEITTLMIQMPGRLYTLPVRALFVQYLHAADATSDRGGLLACQSYAAAARCQLYEMGISPKQSYDFFRTDDQAEEYVQHCLTDAKWTRDTYSNLLSKAARGVMMLSYVEAEGLSMLDDLYQWYRKDYDVILRRYGKEVE